MLTLLPGAFGQTLLFQHATVIDATGAPARADVSLEVRDGRITRIAAGLAPEPGTTVIDATGKFLISGLWDMHVHLRGLERSFRTLVAHGITGVRDMYTGVQASDYASWRNRPYAPRLVLAGRIDGPPGDAGPGAVVVNTADDARAAVRFLTGNGAEFIKVYNALSRDAYLAVADEARRIGAAFAGHVPEAVSPAEAARAGQLSQEHLINILLACSTDEERLRAARVALLRDPRVTAAERARLLGFPLAEGLFDTYSEQKAAALFETFVEYGVWQTPTLAVWKSIARGGEAARRSPLAAGLDDAGFEAFRARVAGSLERHLKLVGDMHRAGVGLLAGSDAGSGVELGSGLHDELELLVEAGLTPMEALQTATRNPGLFYGIFSLMGTLEEGKIADIVMLDANPLEDIRNTRRVNGVVMRGTYFSRDVLLEFARGN